MFILPWIYACQVASIKANSSKKNFILSSGLLVSAETPFDKYYGGAAQLLQNVSVLQESS